MQFTQPLFLLLLVPATVFLWRTWPQVHGMAKFRKRLAFGLRSALLLCLILALAGPQMVTPNKGLCTIFVVDRSMSIRDADRKAELQFVNRYMDRLGPDDLAGIVAFGKEPLVEAAPAGKRVISQIESQIDGTETDIAAAVRLASALFPEGKNRKLVLLTDGNETTGDARQAAMVAETQEAQIDILPLGEHQTDPEASIVQMDAPNSANLGEPIRIRIQVESNVPQAAIIQIERDGKPLKALSTRLATGTTSMVFQDSLEGPGFHKYKATLFPQQDTDPRNNIGAAFVAVRSRPKVLILQEDAAQTTLQTALSRSGFESVVKGPEGVPVTAEEIADYDAIFLNDINADHFLPRQMKLLESSVREGGVGLAMIGGDNSYLPGGYYATPIADALPVDLNIRQRKEFPSASVLIVIDSSGSMGMFEDGIEKIRLAANAAEQTVRLIGPQDRIGVAGSSDSVEFLAPMQRATNKEGIISQIRKLRTEAGGIYCDMSVKFARDVLQKETSKIRHLILLSDGDDAEAQEGCDEIVSALKLQHITTSTVAIGRGKDEGFLQNLAATGGGHYYLADRASKLPAILTQDTSVMSRSAIEEGAFYPKIVGDDQILNGVDATPPLLAYCLTSTRPLANTSMVTPKDDPLLARWTYGLGSSLAFTSDAKPKWAAKWAGWSGFSAFWSQAVRSIARQKGLNNYQISLDQSTGKAQVRIVAQDEAGNPLSKLTGDVKLIRPNGVGQDVEVAEQAPGVFGGSFDSNELGTYILTVSEPGAKGVVRTSSSGFSVPYPPELRTSKPNQPLLKEVAETTGGRLLTSPDQAARAPSKPGVAISDVWSLFLSLAAIILPLDIAVRRVALPFNEIWASFLLLLRRRPKPATAPATSVGRLQTAKRRAHHPSAPDLPKPEQTPSSPPKPTPTAPPKPAAAAERLLEAKRKRAGKE